MNGVVLDVLDITRWRAIESVLDAALDLDPLDVPAHLARACAGDDLLRRQVEALLEADRAAHGFLMVPAIERIPSLTIPGGDARGASPADRPVTSEVPPPTQVGRYAVLQELGRGGMGIVYLGRDTHFGRAVAIKALPESVATDPERLARFLSEAKSLGALHHPNIAAIHGVVHEAGRRYLILERVEGDTLSALLRAGPMPQQQALDVCGQVAEALAAAHTLGIVHCDLKPGNLMVTPGGIAKILDFGLAKHAAWREPRAVSHAASASADHSQIAQPGTPGFMSPEQILGGPQDARSDLFAFGCVLYQCLTGSRAFAGVSVHAVFSSTLSGSVDMSRLPAHTSEPVRGLLIRLLEKDPLLRLSDVREVVAVLTDAGASLESPHARRSARDPRIPRLPESAIPFVGRTREIDAGVRLLDRERMLTLTGAGGSGKTRLAVEITRAWRAGSHVWFADLASAQDSDGVVFAVGAALDVRDPTPQRLAESITRHVNGESGLLVLDNCEHALGPAANLATHLLASCAQLHVLATSREWLGVAGEQTLRIPPLSMPDPEVAATAASTANAESVRLFVACAATGPRGFALTDANAPLVAAICRGLDGVPLGIELTAAQLRDQSLDAIAAALDRHLHHDLPTGTPPALAGPLEAACRLSYERLAEDERRMFRALSVFSGGWTLESAASVGGFDDDAFAALDLLTRLFDASLVTIQRSHNDEPRYRFLEPIRQFAAAHREAAGESPGLLRLHLACFLNAAERMAPALMSQADQARWIARLEADHTNILAALRACDSIADDAHHGLRLAGAVWMFWYVRGHFALGREALSRALAHPDADAPTPARAQALFAAGGLAVFQGDHAAGRQLNGEALERFRALGDTLGMARALNHLALCDGAEGRFDDARQGFREAIRIFEDLGDGRRLAVAMNNLGVVERQQGHYQSARTTFEGALERVRQTGERDSMIVTLVNIALVSLRLGDIDVAARRIGEALDHVTQIGARRAGVAAIEVAADVIAARGNCAEAAELLGAARALRMAIDLPPDAFWQRSLHELHERIRAELGAESLDQRLITGRLLRFDDALAAARRAIACATSIHDHPPQPTHAMHLESTPVSIAPQPRSGT